MSCWWKMFRIVFFYLVLATQHLLYGATPLSGRDVNIAYLDENPFIVSLSKNTSSNYEREELNHFCGGALITTKHILTAAHCLLKHKYHDIVAKVGSIDLRNAEIYEVQMWVTYNKWAGIKVPDELSLAVYDIAVVKLRHSVNIDASMIPEIAFIPKQHLYGRTIKTGGWGCHEDAKFSRYMRIAKFHIHFPQKCNSFQLKDRYLAEKIKKVHLCVSAPGARSKCGDSGNPALFNNKIVAVARGSNKVFWGPTILSQESFFSSLDYDPKFVTEVIKKLI